QSCWPTSVGDRAGDQATRPKFTCVAYVAQAFRPARAPKSRPKGLRYERRAVSTQVNSGLKGICRVLQAALIVAALLGCGVPAAVAADGAENRYALIVSGATGGQEY